MSTETNTDKVLKLQQESSNTTDKQVSTFKPLEGTPFTLVSDEGKVFGIMGKYRLTECFESEEEAEKEVKKITWDRLIQVISIMINEQDKIKNLNEE